MKNLTAAAHGVLREWDIKGEVQIAVEALRLTARRHSAETDPGELLRRLFAEVEEAGRTPEGLLEGLRLLGLRDATIDLLIQFAQEEIVAEGGE